VDVDTAIIGGGVSGLCCRWGLGQQVRAPGDRPFELGDGIGGRRCTRMPSRMPNVPGGLGGMRHVTSTHELIGALIDELGLSELVSPAGDGAPGSGADRSLP